MAHFIASKWEKNGCNRNEISVITRIGNVQLVIGNGVCVFIYSGKCGHFFLPTEQANHWWVTLNLKPFSNSKAPNWRTGDDDNDELAIPLRLTNTNNELCRRSIAIKSIANHHHHHHHSYANESIFFSVGSHNLCTGRAQLMHDKNKKSHTDLSFQRVILHGFFSKMVLEASLCVSQSVYMPVSLNFLIIIYGESKIYIIINNNTMTNDRSTMEYAINETLLLIILSIITIAQCDNRNLLLLY